MTGWWRRRSQAARFDLYFRVNLYANFAVVPYFVALSLLSQPNAWLPGLWTTLAFSVVHSAGCGLLTHRGMNHYLGRRSRPTWLIVAATALTVVGVVAVFVAYPSEPGSMDGQAYVVDGTLAAAYLTALSAAVSLRLAVVGCVAGSAAMFALYATRNDLTTAFGATATLVSVVVLLVVVYRLSLWMLKVVWELDRARQVESNLAVAEERLRFARDLHDVVGRNLSVVALKAELAAQLAKRGRAEAVDEMLEVRRIAQESLAELRAVVGGYRSAPLDVELAGARSVLASAGIDCRIIGDGQGLPPRLQGTLGWVVREGTTNVLRHSEARTATVTLRAPHGGAGGDGVTLTMENDGVPGIEATGGGRVRFGSGLIGLAERIAGLGGTVVAVRQSPDRFRLTVELPSEEPPDEAGAEENAP